MLHPWCILHSLEFSLTHPTASFFHGHLVEGFAARMSNNFLCQAVKVLEPQQSMRSAPKSHMNVSCGVFRLHYHWVLGAFFIHLICSVFAFLPPLYTCLFPPKVRQKEHVCVLLCEQSNHGTWNRTQMQSTEAELVQFSDLIMGTMGYRIGKLAQSKAVQHGRTNPKKQAENNA